MATTSVGADRGQGDGAGQAFEKYNDAAFMRDDKKLYFGTDGNFSIEYDEDGNDVVATAGADLRLSDTQKLQFGDSADVSMSWDGTSLSMSGGDLRLSDTQQLQLGNTSDVTITFNGTNVILGGAFTVALSDTLPGTSGALFLQSDSSNVSDYMLVVRV